MNPVISTNSGNVINCRNINWAQFKDHISEMCMGSMLVSYTRGGRFEPF